MDYLLYQFENEIKILINCKNKLQYLSIGYCFKINPFYNKYNYS